MDRDDHAAATLLLSAGYYLTNSARHSIISRAFAKLDLRLGWASSNDHYSAEVFVTNVTDKVVQNRATFGSGGLNQNSDAPCMFGGRIAVKL